MNGTYWKAMAAVSVIMVFWISISNYQRYDLQQETFETSDNIVFSPLIQNKSVASAADLTPIDKIRFLMKLNYNDEEVIRKSTKHWPNQMAVNSPGKQKTILFFNNFYYWPDFGIGEGSAIFEEMGCPYSNCLATSNKSLVKPEEADALIWHALGDDKSLPKKRLQHSRLVFYLTEPIPKDYFQHLDNPKYINAFNYTMTNSRIADIFDPYGIISKLDKPSTSKTTKNFAEGKTKMAVWFVSGCSSQSYREKVVKEIQKYIEVDIYGRCGTYSCEKNNINQNDERCTKKIEKSHRFYFAFENSLCKDYISEKFFDAMKLDLIPVVYGVGNYEEIAPPHSYINILSFKNVKAAIDHMIYLSKNDTAYNEYFWWKDQYKAVSLFTRRKTPEFKDISWCSLCKKLHTDTQVKSYSHIQDFTTLKNCFNPSHRIIRNFFNY